MEQAVSETVNVPSGPIFVSGRQHCGNTVMSVLLGRLPGCFAQIDENAFFEHRTLVERLKSGAERAARVCELLKIEHDGARESVRGHLQQLAVENPSITALQLYREGMDHATRCAQERFWAQKATSYIFYAREILALLPDARIIYLLRSPYDIAASKKRRHEERERIWSTVTSWNKGLKLAQAIAACFPGRLHIVRYEDLTGSPEETVRSLLAWLGVPFEPACLEVPHVNRSETRYSLTGDGRGLTASRVNYYLHNLSRSEIAAIDLLVDRSLLDSYYPDLPHRPTRTPIWQQVLGGLLVTRGPAHYAVDYARRLWKEPALLVTRTIRRLW